MESPATSRRFSFHLSGSSTRSPHADETLKRCRPITDVDGPNTSSLSCKKRRLRLELITSRLSQPFSLPATHILNREGLARGDKRFVKMGACASMVRRGLSFNVSSSPFWRVALLNRARLHTRDSDPSRQAMVVYSNNAMPSQPYGALLSFQSNFIRRPPLRPQAGVVGPQRAKTPRSATATPGPHNLGLAPTTSPSVDACPFSLRMESVGASASPASDRAAQEIGDDGDDGESFPTANHTALYDHDDDDQVYSDFAAIFGPGAAVQRGDGKPRGRSQGHGDEHSYDEYLDELDGISWIASQG